MLAVKLIVVVFIVVAAAFSAAYLLQDRLIFPRGIAGPALAARSAGVEQVWLDVDKRVRVEGWFIPGSRRSAASPGGAVVFFHGNAELIDHNAARLRQYVDEGLSVLLVEYRGYGRSGGTPSQRAIVEDSLAFLEWVAARPEVDASKIVYHGRSLGGGVAVQLAARRAPAALVLESTFTSVPDVARFPFAGLIIKHPFRSDRVVAALECPILYLHGANDTLIPKAHSERLAELSRNARIAILPGGHNDFPRNDAEFWKIVIPFVSRALAD